MRSCAARSKRGVIFRPMTRRSNCSISSCVRSGRIGKCRRGNGQRRKRNSPSCSTHGSSQHDGQPAPHTKYLTLPYALQPTIQHLTRSSLHRCLQRHGIGRLVDIEGDKPAKKRFKSYPIGFFHIDIAEVQTAEGKLYLFVAIDRTSKFAFVQLVEKANRVTASAFLVGLVEAVPYKIHTVLTDNGIQFRLPPRHANGPTARYTTHMFDLRCREHGIEHRFTKINHPWTNGQVERMNRTIKDATVKRYHYDDHNQLRRHLADFIDAYNFGRRLKTLKGLTPFEFISKCWTSDPQRFKLNPLQQMPGLNTYIAKDTADMARALGLTLLFTPVRSPESNGMSEAFVKTLKRDYASISILPDAATILALLPDWIEDYCEVH